MSVTEFIISTGSKAFVSCVAQFIKYKLKEECIEKDIIVATSTSILNSSSDFVIKNIASKLHLNKTFAEKFAKISSETLFELMSRTIYSSSLLEWSLAFSKEKSDLNSQDIEESLTDWFKHHPSSNFNINDLIQAFIRDFNKNIDAKIHQDNSLAQFFEIIKNGKNIDEVINKLNIIMSQQTEILTTVQDVFNKGIFKLSSNQNEKIIEKYKYDPLGEIIDRKVIPYSYIQESSYLFHIVEAESLMDVCDREKYIVLLGDAGSGKTIELKKLAWQAYDSDYYPFLYSLSNYSGEEIDALIQRQYEEFDTIPLMLIFDAYDEIISQQKDIFARKINSFIKYREVDTIIVISVRNNFYYFSDENGRGGTFKTYKNESFKEYGILPLARNDIEKYIQKQNIDIDYFFSLLKNNSLLELAYNPFYLIKMAEIMKLHKTIPEKHKLMDTIIDASLSFDSDKYRNPDIIYENEVAIKKCYSK